MGHRDLLIRHIVSSTGAACVVWPAKCQRKHGTGLFEGFILAGPGVRIHAKVLAHCILPSLMAGHIRMWHNATACRHPLPAAFEQYAWMYGGGELKTTAWCGTCYVRLQQLDSCGFWSARSIAQGLGFPAGYVYGLLRDLCSLRCLCTDLFAIGDCTRCACMYPPVPCCSVQRLL